MTTKLAVWPAMCSSTEEAGAAAMMDRSQNTPRKYAPEPSSRGVLARVYTETWAAWAGGVGEVMLVK